MIPTSLNGFGSLRRALGLTVINNVSLPGLRAPVSSYYCYIVVFSTRPLILVGCDVGALSSSLLSAEVTVIFPSISLILCVLLIGVEAGEVSGDIRT